MPPLPRLRVPALAEIARRLRYVPPKAARRQLEAAEAMAADIDPAAMYPEDWIIFRLTGYRPEIAHPALVPGSDLLSDLSPLIEHLCVAAKLGEGDLGDAAQWIGAVEVCRRWGVSRKTLDRYRREGLLARRVAVQSGSARHRLVFSGSAIAAFEARHAGKLARAAGFSRIDPDLEERIARRAVRYRQRLGWSLGQVSAHLAIKYGRGRETIRQLILRNDACSPEPAFARRGPLRSVQREIIERAYDRGCGVDAGELARRHGISTASVYRILAERRAARLRELLTIAPLSPAPPAFERPDVEASVLAVPVTREGLGLPGPATVAELIDFVTGARPEGPRVELARATAFFYLRHDAFRRIARLPRTDPSVAELDEIETRLRWAARLKAEMVRSQLPLAAKSIESFLRGRPLASLPSRVAAQVVSLAIDAIIEGVERYDPFKGGRLAAPVALALSRAISHWARADGAALLAPSPASRAAPLADPASAPLDEFTRRVSPWQAWLEPDARIRAGLDKLPGDLADLLAQRHGWGVAPGVPAAGPPQTLAAIAARRGVIPARISRLEHRAKRLALGLPAKAPRAGVSHA